MVGSSVVYASGSFDHLGGLVRHRIAAIDFAGQVTPWNPDANGIVHGLLLRGATLYVGGEFTTLGGQPRAGLGAVDAVTALPTPWSPVANAPVWHAGHGRRRDALRRRLLTVVNGEVRHGVAALDPNTGALRAGTRGSRAGR